MEDKIKWIIDQHKKTNHFYDEYLPYEFHLRMVVEVANDNIHLVHSWIKSHVILAAWGHDLIEDTRTSYNDVKNILGEDVADIVYALTNEKGKSRKERANDKYYEGIRRTPGAVFVKLCDRIANVQYSKMTKSRMFDVYKNENEEFIKNLGGDDGQYEEIFTYLKSLMS